MTEERLKELAVQAGFKLNEFSDMGDGYWSYDKELRKFAELIEAEIRSTKIEKIDICTDPDNCKRCKAPQYEKHKLGHAGIPL